MHPAIIVAGGNVPFMQRLGLVLVPERAVADRITAFTQRLMSTIGTPQSCLGEGAIPHVSLAHVKGPMTATEVWQDISPIVDNQLSLLVTGLRFHRYTPYNSSSETGGGVAAFLMVALDDPLVRQREQVARTSWIQSGEVTYGQFNALYEPHFTLGTTKPSGGLLVRGDVELPADLIGHRVDCRLHVGPIGEHGVFQESLIGASA